MNLRDEIRRRFSEQPPGTAESAGNLQAALEEARRAKGQLAEVQAELAEAQRLKFGMLEDRGQLQPQSQAVPAQLAQAKAYIAELQRQLLGLHGERLSDE